MEEQSQRVEELECVRCASSGGREACVWVRSDDALEV